MKIGVVGLGYWGPNLVRNFLSTEGVDGVVCFDVSENSAGRTKKRFPAIQMASSFENLLADPGVAAVVLATPVSTHYPLGIQALRAGKHLLVEKPLATTSSEVLDLMETAEKRNLVLAVDHTFVYTGPVRKLKEMILEGTLGDVLYYDSVRINLGLFQHDVNVLWDLATHDLAIMDYLIGAKPTAVSAVGVRHYNSVEDMAYVTVHFENNLLAHFHVNWLSPVKIRTILIGGSKRMVVYNDMEPGEKLKVYDRGVEITGEESIHSTLVQYRIGEMYSPVVKETEALSLLTAEFVECIRTGNQPTTGGRAGLNVVRVLEAADRSLKSGGNRIELTY